MSKSFDTMDCSPSGSSVHGILQAKILECVAFPLSRGSSLLSNGTQASCSRLSLPSEPPEEPLLYLPRKKITSLYWRAHARPCSRPFPCVITLIFTTNLRSVYRWRNWGMKKWNNFLQMIQLIQGQPGPKGQFDFTFCTPESQVQSGLFLLDTTILFWSMRFFVLKACSYTKLY